MLLKMVQVICNRDDRRLRRMQGGAVGAAASKTQAKRCGCWEPHPGLVEQSETERFIPLYTKSARRITRRALLALTEQ